MRKFLILIVLAAALPTVAVSQKEEKKSSRTLSQELQQMEDYCQNLSFNGDEELENPELHRAISRCLGPEAPEKTDVAFKE